jgi:hypothetical protein
VNEEPIHVQRLVTRRIGRLELDGSTTFCVANSRTQRCLEQFHFELWLHSERVARGRRYNERALVEFREPQ